MSMKILDQKTMLGIREKINENLQAYQIKNLAFKRFINSNLLFCDFKDTKIFGCKFRDCVLEGATMQRIVFEDCDFRGSEFVDCVFDHSCTFINCTFNEAIFHDCEIRSNFKMCSLDYTYNFGSEIFSEKPMPSPKHSNLFEK